KRPTGSTARLAATMRKAISRGRAPSTSKATKGIAVRVTTEPSSETVWPAHSLAKSGFRHSDSVTCGLGTDGGRAMAAALSSGRWNGSLAETEQVAVRVGEPRAPREPDLGDEVGGLGCLVFLEGHSLAD